MKYAEVHTCTLDLAYELEVLLNVSNIHYNYIFC